MLDKNSEKLFKKTKEALREFENYINAKVEGKEYKEIEIDLMKQGDRILRNILDSII